MEMSDNRIRVLCAEDNRDLATMLQAFIDSEDDMCCVGLAESRHGLAEMVAQSQADVVVMDLSMPGGNPIQTLRDIGARSAGSRVLIHSGYDDQTSIDQAVAAGAWGFVSKHGDPQRLIDAIRRVSAGEMVIATGAAPFVR